MKKPRFKKPTKRNRFYVPGAIWEHATKFCKCYPLWVAELSACDSSRAIRYDLDKIQTNGDSNPTEDLGIKRAELQRKIDIVENSVNAVTESKPLRKFLLLGVTHGLSFETLEQQHIPCGRRMYYEMRREVIFRVSKEL